MLGKPRVIRGMYRMGGMMAKRSAFLDIIKEKGALVLDGALGTELERYGCDIQHKLWSAKVLMDQPDIIKKIHIWKQIVQEELERIKNDPVLCKLLPDNDVRA